ncbi:hypothetical protein C3L33_19293, partial [Rhododendron williamsianum]
DELLNLLSKKPEPVCYDGFEPSGRMHIAQHFCFVVDQGIMKIISVNKMTSAGCKVKIWIADLFAQMNNKMGGDLKKINDVGKYMIEVWTAAGMNLQGGKVEFLWSSEEINSRGSEYLPLVTDIASRFTLSRIKRCAPIMGRSEEDELTASQVLYPCMQCADIFFLKVPLFLTTRGLIYIVPLFKVDICQMGMDQRKVNVLAREYCDLDKSKNKPIILSHHMLPGLKQGQEKMSKSDPSSSIFMDDKEEQVNLKIKKAYCPPMVVQGNPCLEYIEHIILPWFHEFKVERSADNGGEKLMYLSGAADSISFGITKSWDYLVAPSCLEFRTFESFEELVADYESGNLHPADVKAALSKALNKILQVLYFFFDVHSTAYILSISCFLLLFSNQKPKAELSVISELKIQPEAPIISSDKNISVISELSEFCSFSESLWTEAEKRDDNNGEPVHDHFDNNPEASDLLTRVQVYEFLSCFVKIVNFFRLSFL